MPEEGAHEVNKWVSELEGERFAATTMVMNTPLKTNIALKMVVCNRNLLFQGSIFRGYVSFREGMTFNWFETCRTLRNSCRHYYLASSGVFPTTISIAKTISELRIEIDLQQKAEGFPESAVHASKCKLQRGSVSKTWIFWRFVTCPCGWFFCRKIGKFQESAPRWDARLDASKPLGWMCSTKTVTEIMRFQTCLGIGNSES